jgi:uncharacterized Zn-finger protein
MKVHSRTNSGETSYSWSLCSKSFTTSSGLQAHLRTHSVEKPFSWSLRWKTFSVSSGLQVHLRIYSVRNRTGYSCLTCTKSFSRSDELNHHINQCCGSRIQIFSIPDPGSVFFHPGSRIHIKALKYFTNKNLFLSSRKYDLGCSSRIPDPDPEFYPSRILDPRVEKAPDRGSRIRIRNTDVNSGICKLTQYDFQHLWLLFFLVNILRSYSSSYDSVIFSDKHGDSASFHQIWRLREGGRWGTL